MKLFFGMILEKRKIKVSGKSIIAAQKGKKKKKVVCLILGKFECVLTQNQTYQDSQLSWFFHTIWKAVRKSKNMRFQEIVSAWKWFQILLCSEFSKKM